MAREDHWRIDADRPGVADLPIGGHPSSEENQTPGGGYDLPLYLTARSDSPTDEWPDHTERYQRLVRFQDHAGAFHLHEIEDGSVAFTEYHDGESLLVTLKPPVDAPETSRGGFYLVGGVSDATTLPSTLAQLQFSLVFVAKLDTGDTGEAGYQTRREVRSALEAPTLI